RGEWIRSKRQSEENGTGYGIEYEKEAHRSKRQGLQDRDKVRVLVTFAVEAEFAPWRKLRELHATEIDGSTIYRTQIGRAEVDFVVTGMGLDNARRATERVMSGTPYTICIASGFAGSLNSKHKLGDILVPRAAQQTGQSKTVECSRNLYSSACQSQAIPAKLFLTTDQVVMSSEEKRRLGPFGDAVDMESFAVLWVAIETNVPGVAIRVVSERLDEDLPVDIETTVDEKGHVRAGGVIRYIARHPLQLPALI